MLLGWLSGIAWNQTSKRGGSDVPPAARTQQPRSVNLAPEVRQLFRRIEQALSSGSIEAIASEFSPSVMLSIQREEPGVYSSGQSASILINYFLSRKPLSFVFSRFGEQTATPYATGRLSFVQKGSRETAQVYVSLRRMGSRWRIHQFNIY